MSFLLRSSACNVLEQRITACAAADVRGFDVPAAPRSPTGIGAIGANCMSPVCPSAVLYVQRQPSADVRTALRRHHPDEKTEEMRRPQCSHPQWAACCVAMIEGGLRD